MVIPGPIRLPPGQCEELERAYSIPPRAYHHFGHVLEVLRSYDQVAGEPGWERPVETWLAVLYHDAVYEAGRKDNEARSAALATTQIARWLPAGAADAARVADLILMTARHGKIRTEDVDRDAALFLDCDMAVLGADPATFDAYDRGIAAEYRGHVPDWLFRLHRRRFLKGLLVRDRIFLSPYFHERLDAQARANLRRAVTTKR